MDIEPTNPPDKPFGPGHPPLCRGAAREHFPHADLHLIDQLATIWDEIVHRIVSEMMELSLADQAPLHINLREEMVLELARLQFWLGEKVVQQRTKGRNLVDIQIQDERDACLGPGGATIISGTARMAYEHIWSRRMDERWKPKTARAVEREANPRRPRLAIKPVGKNHFISRWFIRDNWAIDGKVLCWRRVGDKWSSKPRGFGEWGYRHSLYSDRLEAYFSLLEGDSKLPVEMLLSTKPLNGPQREAFVGFLIIHMLRNPLFMEFMHKGLVPTLAEIGHANDPEMLSKGYESMFGNNELYGQLASPVMQSQWAIVRSKEPVFVLPDTFGLYERTADGLRVIAPMTPTTCFVTLPEREQDKRIVPRHLVADESLANRISSMLINIADEDFLSHADFQPRAVSAEVVPPGALLKEISAAIGP